MHSPADSENRETDGQEHFYIYGGFMWIMWKLGLNKAPVGGSPRERTIPRNELVQLELREGIATTHTLQLSIIQSYYIMMFQTGTKYAT